MSVDFGSEWMKVAIVSPGVPMEIALNKESKRKTPAFIAFRNNERTFGEDAQNVAVRFPSNGYGYLLDLLGKKLDNPIVKLYRKRFPYYLIEDDPLRGTVVFRHDEETTFTPEELIGMLLHKAKEFAEESAGQPITDAVIVVPGYFNQAERRALYNATNLGGLKVLQLINDYTAVALNYGIFRAKDFNETTQYILFYDMGASSTTATIVAYQMIKQKDRGIVETHPQATVIGVGYDRTLGGLEIQLRLQQHLAKKFTETKKTKSDLFSNPRAMAKLFKEAGRVKNVLSANIEHYAQVEGLLDEEDFKLLVTREELENMCKDLFDRVKDPILQALKTSGITMDIINQVILVGAGTRMPKIQEILSDVVKKELGKNINTDEAAVMGAVYKAADIATGFKVKKFISKDAVVLPIQVTFQKSSNNSSEVKYIKKTLFNVMNPFPQKKILTFSKHVDDFDFNVHYGEMDHLPQKEIEALGPLNLSLVHVNGVKSVLDKHEGKNVESKGIKAHFAMDESGLLHLLNIDYVAEKTVTGDGEEESTLKKLGSSFTKLFGGYDTPAEELGKTASGETNGETVPTADEKQNEKPAKDGEKVEKVQEKNATATAEVKPQIIVIKENISATYEDLGVPPLSTSQMETSLKKILELDDFDNQKQKKEKSRNALESFVFDALQKIETDVYSKSATDKEKETIIKECQEISNWLDEEFDADAETYETKLKEIKTLTSSLYKRVSEHEERPEALSALKAMLNGSEHFLNTIRTKTKETLDRGDEAIFTDVEMNSLEKIIKETEEWKSINEIEQSKLPLSSPPKLTIKSITDKMAALDREVKYLVNKAKLWRPKSKPTNQTKEGISKGKVVNGTEKNETQVPAAEKSIEGSEDSEKVLDTESVGEPNESSGAQPEVKEETISTKESYVTEKFSDDVWSWAMSALVMCLIHFLFTVPTI
ncbi:hypothetical protein RUM44_013795 [Polyplax serrata]|uniref:Hypoxia up-regulated protein 1 n=1 Tax=Polyplax serrata TaxID=468196 RepID=A0ABR1BJ96_POLSC